MVDVYRVLNTNKAQEKLFMCEVTNSFPPLRYNFGFGGRLSPHDQVF